MRLVGAVLSVSLSLLAFASATAAPASKVVTSSDYLAHLGPAGTARWRPSHNPIKVWISTDEKVEGYKPEFVPIVKKAFQEWTDALKGKVKFVFVGENEKPDITVRFSTKRIEIPCQAYTYATPEPDGFLDTASITLITLDKQQKPEGDETIHGMALHEVGHALGLTGHSNGTADMMCPHVNVAPGQHHTLSQADKNTMLRLYTADPYATTRPAALAKIGISRVVEKHRRLNNEAVYALLHKQYPIAVEKLNAALQIDPNYSYAMDNMRIATYNWALAEFRKGNYAKSQELAEQSVDWAKKLKDTAGEQTAMEMVRSAKSSQTQVP